MGCDFDAGFALFLDLVDTFRDMWVRSSGCAALAFSRR
jgi:hypothetical protein